MANLPKSKVIFPRDFQSSLFGNYSINGEKKNILAEFYDISKEEKDILFKTSTLLNEVLKTDILKRNGLQLESFNIALDDAKDIIKNIPSELSRRIVIVQDDKGFAFGIRAELKYEYQTKQKKVSMKPF